MIIADETDAAAEAKWEHYKDGTDLEALAWRDGQATNDTVKDPMSVAGRFVPTTEKRLPTNQGVLSAPTRRSPPCWTSWPRYRACKAR